ESGVIMQIKSGRAALWRAIWAVVLAVGVFAGVPSRALGATEPVAILERQAGQLQGGAALTGTRLPDAKGWRITAKPVADRGRIVVALRAGTASLRVSWSRRGFTLPRGTRELRVTWAEGRAAVRANGRVRGWFRVAGKEFARGLRLDVG